MKPAQIADLARDLHGLDLTPADAARLATELERLNRAGTEMPTAFDADPTVDFRLALRRGAGP
jgi:hypothetical protein